MKYSRIAKRILMEELYRVESAIEAIYDQVSSGNMSLKDFKREIISMLKEASRSGESDY